MCVKSLGLFNYNGQVSGDEPMSSHSPGHLRLMALLVCLYTYELFLSEK